MSTYVLPQVLVFQDFQTVASDSAHPLRAHISGGNATLVRYAQSTEQALGRLGFYDDVVDTAYNFPNRPAGAIVDGPYTKLWLQDALLQYFDNPIDSGSNVTTSAGSNNRIRSDSVNFAKNGAYSRDASLLDRDVQLGDVAKVRYISGGDPVELWTYVQAIEGDPIAASAAAATADTGNAPTQGASTAITMLAGDVNCVTLTADGSTYNGLPDGNPTETYTVQVLDGSVEGDYTTARLRILSASGNDDVLSVTPAAAGNPTAIGTRGLTVTFSVNHAGACSSSATTEDVSPIDLLAGQKWQVVVHQAWTAPVATEAGTYSAGPSTTYIVEVVRGGLYSAPSSGQPQIQVTTTNSIDLSGPTTVTAANTAVAMGTKGLTIAFSGTGLSLGDRYYVVVTGSSVGPMRTLVLGNSLPTSLASGTRVGVTLFIMNPLLQIPQDRQGFAPQTNWDLSDTQITVHSGIVAYDPTWTNNGVPEPLPVLSETTKNYGILFVEYRAWLSTLCNTIESITDIGDIDTLIPGPLDPDNPLKWAVAQALANAGGTTANNPVGSAVKFTSVCNPDDPNSWLDVLALLDGRDDVYGLVPLTHDQTVLTAYEAHVNAESTPEQGLWRVLWTNLQGLPEIPIVSAGSTVPGHTAATTSDGNPCLCTFTDDPNAAGTQFTIVTCPAANGKFLTNKVQPGDIARGQYVGDGFGNFTYTEYIIDAVLSEDQVRLLAGPGVAQNVPARIEIWRNLSATEEAAAIALNSGAWGSPRVRSVWPDTIDSGTTTMDGFHLCAALAGLASGILPHQGMTRLQITGFTAVPRTTAKFNRSQLDSMAVSGTWIVTQDLTAGTIFTRHAVTTAPYDNIDQREEMVIRNFDSISFRWRDHFAPFIGITNVTPSNQALLLLEAKTLIDTLKTESATPQLGGQLIDATIVSFGPHAILLDRYVMIVDCRLPIALNSFELHLVI